MAERLLQGEADVMGAGGESPSEDVQAVEVGSVELMRPRSAGVEQVAAGGWSSWGWRSAGSVGSERTDVGGGGDRGPSGPSRFGEGDLGLAPSAPRGALVVMDRGVATEDRIQRTLHVRKATRAEPDQKAIYDALGIDPAPGGVRKMIVCPPPQSSLSTCL